MSKNRGKLWEGRLAEGIGNQFTIFETDWINEIKLVFEILIMRLTI